MLCMGIKTNLSAWVGPIGDTLSSCNRAILVEWIAKRGRAGHAPARPYDDDSEDLLRRGDAMQHIICDCMTWTSQNFVDTPLRPVRHGFKRLRTDPAQMAVSTGAILEHFDVLVDLGIGQIPSPVDAFLDPLLLQTAKEGFGHGGIPTVATPAHTGFKIISRPSFVIYLC